MVEVMTIIIIVTVVTLLFSVVLSLIYLVSIVLVQRFHRIHNILTGNVCLTAIICSLYWIIYTLLIVFLMPDLGQTIFWCIFSSYPSSLVTFLFIHSVIVITINRFVAIKYSNKAFFKRHTWPFLSSALQWFISIILSIPNLILSIKNCICGDETPYWISVYTFVILIIFPIIVNTIFNSLIFVLVRSSTRRIHTLATLTNSTVNANNNIRDIHLLKHILFISMIFLIGYLPIYTIRISHLNAEVIFWASQLVQFLPVISGLIIIIDLFWYNRDLTKYLIDKIFR